MAGSLVQTAVVPTLHGNRNQLHWSAKNCAIARVTASKLEARPPSLRLSETQLPHTLFLGSGSILTGQAMHPVRKRTRHVAVMAMFEEFNGKSIHVLYCSFI
jgi:hypothetical protein